jgi:hypothetical protein
MAAKVSACNWNNGGRKDLERDGHKVVLLGQVVSQSRTWCEIVAFISHKRRMWSGSNSAGPIGPMSVVGTFETCRWPLTKSVIEDETDFPVARPDFSV